MDAPVPCMIWDKADKAIIERVKKNRPKTGKWPAKRSLKSAKK
jgi:hypothetical protein